MKPVASTICASDVEDYARVRVLLMAKALTMLKTMDLRYGDLRFGKLGAFLNAGELAGLWYHSNNFHRGNKFLSVGDFNPQGFDRHHFR